MSFTVAPDLMPKPPVDVSEPPFALADIVLDLPCPPSTNAIWRSDKGRRPHRSGAYKKWLQAADMAALVQGAVRGRKTIEGPFEALIFFDRAATRADLDNVGTKALFDWAQSRSFIANDRLCQRYTVAWVEPERAPHGCRLRLWACP